MKTKQFLIGLVIIFSTMAIPTMASSLTRSEWKEKVAGTTAEQNEARLQELKERTEEIKSMDKSQLTRDERKSLKTELKEMRKEVRTRGGGIYISIGALIIIILLLIIIL